jgi:heptosyltransferase-2
MTVPVIHEIRRKYPAAEFIVVVKGPAQAALLQSAPYITEIVQFPSNNNFKRLISFFWTLRRMKFDTIFISTGTRSLYAIMIYLLCNIRVRIGDGRRFTMVYSLNYTKSTPTHRVDRQLSMVELWTRSPPIVDLSLPIDRAAAIEAASYLEANELREGEYVVIHPGSNKGEDMKQKRIPIDLATQIADSLVTSSNIKVVLILGPDDLDLESKCEGNDPRIVVTSRVSLDVTKYILSKAKSFIGSDSSLGHIASAFNVSTTTLIGPTNPTVSLPRGANAKIARSREELACRPCWFTPLQGKCPISLRCMTSIKVDDVVQVASNGLDVPASQ